MDQPFRFVSSTIFLGSYLLTDLYSLTFREKYGIRSMRKY
jgi:hypothetical protein